MAYTKYSLTPSSNTAAPPDGAPEGMLPSAVNDTMRDMMAQIRDCGDGIRDGTYTMTAPKITGGTITGAAFTGNTFTSPVISGGTINNATIGATTATTGKFTTLEATGVATFSAGTVSLPAITTTGDTNTGIFFPAADTIAFTEGGAESMRISSAGDVGIGNTTPSSFSTKLVVSQAASVYGDERKVVSLIDTTALAAGVGAGISFYGTSESGGGTSQFGSIKGIKENATSANYAGALAFVTSNSANVQTERMRLNSTGALVLSGGTTSATGTGITFPATQSASSDANTLDDYEEGTFTPTVRGLGTAGTTTYTVQNGSYTKIGRVVIATFKVGYSAATGTGALSVRGFPFAGAGSGANAEFIGAVMADGLNMPNSGSYAAYLDGLNASSGIEIYTTTDNGALDVVQISNETASIWASVTYFTS